MKGVPFLTTCSKDDMSFAGVHILGAPYKIDKEYEYFIPTEFRGKISIGAVVIVPFGGGNRHVAGIVSSVYAETALPKYKSIIGLTPGNLCIGEELYGICEFLKERCFCSIGDASKAVLPSGFSVRTSILYEYAGKEPTDEINVAAAEIVRYVSQKGEVSESELKGAFQKCIPTLKLLCTKGYLRKISRADCKVNTKSSNYVRLLLNADELYELHNFPGTTYTPKQLAAIFELEKNPFSPVDEFRELSGVSDSVLRELRKKNVVEILPIPKDRNPYADIKSENTTDFELSECQKNAFDKLCELYRSETANAALLHGVTGSGKTNVMQKLVDVCVSDGKSVIILVPEIALTSQAVGIFVKRYGDKVAVLHSGLSTGERLDAWKRINSGDAPVVLGTRSAIFAPVKNLGLIIIDEEQEASFKSEMTPRYHARDIARFRCAKNDALMLLCSATPSIESYYKAQKGIYTLVEMTERFGNAALPNVEMCDLRNDEGNFGLPDNIPEVFADGKKPIAQKILGDRLLSEIKNNLENKQQTILFINRRGYQSFLSCKKCGFVMECPYCSVSMTYHKYGFRREGKMVCHYCGHTADVPKLCPVCGSEHISAMGTGTQMLEEQLGLYFPEARLLRMDTDTTGGKFSHDTILKSFRNGEADILLGTQMVTKGHDFPNVSLVGVINADASLHIPDFRANEKTFSLMTQVVGRAGRGDLLGRALVQTYAPDHEVLIHSSKQDYKRFYESEIRFRQAAKYPPFCDIAVVCFTAETENEVQLAVSAFGRELDEAIGKEFSDVKLIVFGPFEAGIYKIAGKYRMRYIIKCRNNPRTRQLFSHLYSHFPESNGNVSMSIDMDPQNL